jgi:hypothetical protein
MRLHFQFSAKFDYRLFLDVIIAIIATFFAKAIIAISQLLLSIMRKRLCQLSRPEIDRNNRWGFDEQYSAKQMRGRFACFAFFWRAIEKTEGGRGDRGPWREQRMIEEQRALERKEL